MREKRIVVEVVKDVINLKRSYTNTINNKLVDKKVRINGWVSKKRDLGGIIFLDIRDVYGIVQVIIKPDNKYYEQSLKLKNEYVVEIEGLVIKRSNVNDNLLNGDIEIDLTKLTLLNTSLNPPMIIQNKTDALEELRLKYRYLDLRRQCMKDYQIQRSNIINSIRRYLIKNKFFELDTPILAKSTPEGARDFLVPSRLYEGQFYALPQSPQIFKQLYMISGFDRYFQFAKCFRDEDLRSDRQLEFTQIDIETSFLNEKEIQKIIEGMLKQLFKDVLNINIKTPFLRLDYNFAINTYGSDKPDLRYDLRLNDLKEYFKNVDFMKDDETIKGIYVDSKVYTRKEIDEFLRILKMNKAKNLSYLIYSNNTFSGSLNKFLDCIDLNGLKEKFDFKENSILFISSGFNNFVNQALGVLRKLIAKDLNLEDPNKFSFCWVVNWPIFEKNPETNEYEFTTHPFTAPKKGHEKYLDLEKEKCLADAYDIVLNGYELGSGSLRVYNQELQEKIFSTIGISKKEAKERFGFFIDALKYGTPPHGGIALGIERIVMCMTKTDNIKDVVAFPKTQAGRDLMMESPSSVDKSLLKDVHIKSIKSKK